MSQGKKQERKEYQKNYREAKKATQFFYSYFFFHCLKMRKVLVFKIKHNNYTEEKYYFQKDKKKLLLMR